MIEKTLEPKLVSKNEIWVGDCKMTLVENIIYCIAAKNPDAEHAQVISQTMYKLANLVEGDVYVILDISDTGRPTRGAIDVFKRMPNESPKIAKYAFVGANPVAAVLAKIIMKLINNKNIVFFKTKEDAVTWFNKIELRNYK